MRDMAIDSRRLVPPLSSPAFLSNVSPSSVTISAVRCTSARSFFRSGAFESRVEDEMLSHGEVVPQSVGLWTDAQQRVHGTQLVLDIVPAYQRASTRRTVQPASVWRGWYFCLMERAREENEASEW